MSERRHIPTRNSTVLDEAQPEHAARLTSFSVADGSNRSGILQEGNDNAPQNDIEGGLRAWLCVLGAFTLVIPSYGFMNSVGTVQSYLQLNQLHEYSTSDVGWITGTYLFLSYFFNIQIGPICDHFGPMLVGTAGVAVTVASFVLLAECTTYWQFMLCLGVFGALGGALNATIALSVVAKLFVRRQGLAMGVSLTGSSVGSIVFPVILRSTLPSLGWQWSMRIVALTIAAVTIPGLVCFYPFGDLRVGPSGRHTMRFGRALLNFSAFRSRSFSLISLGDFLLEFAIFGIAGLLPTIATSVGFSQEDGFALIAILSACSCVGRILPGLAGDLVGPFNVILVMNSLTLVFMLTLFIPFASTSVPVLYAFSALWGFGSGSFLSINPACLGKTCGAEDYGRFYGTMTFFASFAVLLAVPVSGVMLDNMGTQALAGILTAIVFLGGICYTAARGVMIGKWLSIGMKI